MAPFVDAPEKETHLSSWTCFGKNEDLPQTFLRNFFENDESSSVTADIKMFASDCASITFSGTRHCGLRIWSQEFAGPEGSVHCMGQGKMLRILSVLTSGVEIEIYG